MESSTHVAQYSKVPYRSPIDRHMTKNHTIFNAKQTNL